MGIMSSPSNATAAGYMGGMGIQGIIKLIQMLQRKKKLGAAGPMGDSGPTMGAIAGNLGGQASYPQPKFMGTMPSPWSAPSNAKMMGSGGGPTVDDLGGVGKFESPFMPTQTGTDDNEAYLMQLLGMLGGQR